MANCEAARRDAHDFATLCRRVPHLQRACAGTTTAKPEIVATATGSPSTALVLSGGGARGAYAVGVLAGLHAILGGLRSRFDLFTGTSVGAIHAADFAAHAAQEDLGVTQLVRRYEQLRLRTHLHPHLPRGRRHDWSLVDPRPFEKIVRNDIPWERLHRNIRDGLVRGLIVSGLRVSDGRTTTFAELAPGAELVMTHDPRRDAVFGPITADHVLASAALPLLFPSRRIGDTYYCDGGLRFNTPMAPAIRTGAQRLVVIALRQGRPSADTGIEHYPKPFFLLGKILDALLLDPIEYDLHILDRLNHMLAVMEQTMPEPALEQVRAVLESERGLPYKQIQTLVFRPSTDLGVLAGTYVRSEQPARREGLAARVFIHQVGALGDRVEADFVSFLLFDGGFARLLIDLGRRDAMARADEIRAFFGVTARRPTLRAVNGGR
jgi:NTE family protein